MRYLLDSRVFLWWCARSSRLSPAAFDLIKQADRDVYVSLLSIREIQIKSQLGMVDLPQPIIDIFRMQHNQHHFQLLAVELSHMEAMISLPNHHIDSFDRVLISQAIAEDMTIVTPDLNFTKYDVRVLW